MTEEDDLTCQNPRPSQAYSQDISCPFSRIFGSIYQKCLLDHDTEAYLKLSRQSDDRSHQDFMQKLEQISLKHDTVQQCINDVEQCIIEKRTSSMVASGSDSDRMINANPLNILSPSNLNADDNKLDCLFEKHGLLSTSDIFFNGKSRRLYSSTNKVKDHQFPVVDVKASGAPKHTTIEKRIKTKAQDDFQNAMKIRFSPKIEEREQLEMEWKKLTAKNNFLKNPRYETEVGKPAHVTALFEAEPKLVTFRSYQVSRTYETQVRIRNVSNLTRSIRILPPESVYFSLSEGKFPKQQKNLIAPGMAAIFTIKFAPETLGDYDDALLVEYEAQNRPLVIPIQARRPRPEVNIPDVFNVDYCLVYAPKVVSFELRRSNKSPDADTRFIFMTTDTFEQYQNEGLVHFDSYWSKAMRDEVTSIGSFSLDPAGFILSSEQPLINIRIIFAPTTLGEHTEPMFVIADNGENRAVQLKGFAEAAAVELKSIDGLLPDEDLKALRCVTKSPQLAAHIYHFPQMYPHTAAPKRLLIRNRSHSELPFEWIITEQTLNSDKKGKPTLDNWKTPTPFEDLDETTKVRLFEVHPSKGTLKPDDFTSFELVCSPSKIGNFYAIFKLVLSKVPTALGGSPENLIAVDLEPIEVEVRATVVELPTFLEPNVFILPGKHLLGVPIHRFVKLKNCSDHCPITFCWESETTKSCMTLHSTTTGDYSARKSGSVAHTPNSTDEMLVLFEPVLGEVQPGEEAHIDVCVSSSRVGHFVEKLACHIDCLPGNPLWLHLDCEFQAPAMLTDQAEYNLGVVLLGHSMCQKVVITNPAPTTRHWKIHIRCGTDLVPSDIITVEPTEGKLEPFKSDTLNLRFKPCGKGSICYFFHLVTEDSTDPVSRLILAEVQTPLLDLSPTTLHLEQLYRSIPKTAVFSLNNLTLLDTDFCWLQPFGDDAKYTDLTVVPTTGRLLACERLEMRLTMTFHKQKLIQDLVVPCEVPGMAGHLELKVSGTVQGLSVIVRHLGSSPVNGREDSPSLVSSASMTCPSLVTPKLDLGNEILIHHPVQFWIELHNPTPIDASVRTEVQNFGIKGSSVQHASGYNPSLGVYGTELIGVTKTGVFLNGHSILVEQRQNEKRLFFGWCSTFLKGTAGSCLFAHSGLLSSTEATGEVKAVFPCGFYDHDHPTYPAQPNWTLPASSHLRICFILLANMWGRYKDTLRLLITSVCARSDEPEPPVVEIPIRYAFVGCPILLTALGPFGQVINSLGRQLGTAALEEPMKRVILSEANQINVHMGTRMPGDKPVLRQIKLYNSSSSRIRIDWQVFLDAPIDKTDKLLDVVCYTEPVFTPNRPASYGSLADGHELGLLSTAENRGPGIVKLLVRPHDGLLIWQSDRANIAPKPISPRNLFHIRPEQIVLNPLQDGQVEIVYDPTEAAELMGCVNQLGFRARALGYVTDDDDDEEGRKNEFNQTGLCRTLALETDRITLFIAAELEKPGLQIDMDDCMLTKSQQSSDLTYTVPFVMGIGELLFRHETCPTNQTERGSSDSQICVCERKSKDDIVALHEQVLLLRNVRVRSTNRMPIRVCLACLGDSHFGFLPIEAEEKLQRERIYPEPVVLQSSSVMLILPRETRKITLALQLTPSDLTLVQNAASSVGKKVDLGEDRLSFESHITLDVYSTERGTSGQKNPSNSTSYVLNLQGYVSRTRFHVFPRDCVDFGTVFLGESQHREIRLCNRSSTRAYWSISQCASLLSANNAATITLYKIKSPRPHEEYFRITPTSGVLGSQESESGSVGVIIRFQPTKLGVFENAFVVRGIFGETEMQIHVRGQCSSDERYRSLIGT